MASRYAVFDMDYTEWKEFIIQRYSQIEILYNDNLIDYDKYISMKEDITFRIKLEREIRESIELLFLDDYWLNTNFDQEWINL